MTYRELYRQIKSKLELNGCDSPAFDAGCLLEQIGGISRGWLPVHGDEIAPSDVCSRMETAAQLRAAGHPLQYIIGVWDFLSLTLEVGEGVLIPRADTELLCETVAGRLAEVLNPRVLDLCAGSGCVGLGIASLRPGADVTAVELSQQAFEYLRRNCARYPQFNVRPAQADVLHDSHRFSGDYNAIVSNPPYIPTRDLPFLMREVKHEPMMALDGGDGLIFYRAIAQDWLPKLAIGGICAVEIGIGQADDVSTIFAGAGLSGIEIFRDLAGVERVVLGEKLI